MPGQTSVTLIFIATYSSGVLRAACGDMASSVRLICRSQLYAYLYALQVSSVDRYERRFSGYSSTVVVLPKEGVPLLGGASHGPARLHEGGRTLLDSQICTLFSASSKYLADSAGSNPHGYAVAACATSPVFTRIKHRRAALLFQKKSSWLVRGIRFVQVLRMH